jgi:4,5:9,10-diseco-3-hydroxy-5,9,17-trioxoandrosta-1(10),2-diene-4-oate hydrolase
MNAPASIDVTKPRTIGVGARQISYVEIGQGPAVLMLHGGGPGASGLSNYSRNVEYLSRHFRVLVPDMPGYGKSTKGVDRNDPFGDLASSMLRMLEKLGIKRAHVIGNSLGGACALRMALDRPHAVGRLVLMGPGGVDTTRGLPTSGLKRLLTYYKGTGPTLEKLTTFIRGDLVYDGTLVSDALIKERYLSSIDPEVVASPPLLGPKGIPNFRRLDFTRDARLHRLQNPTLVLWGTEDRVNRPSGAHSLQRRLPNCDVHLYSKTGHWVQWERADEFNATVHAFLEQDSRDAAAATRI